MVSPGGKLITQGLKSDDYRPCFSGHETFPLRYGWLQKAYRFVYEADSPNDAVHVFRDPASIARFGVGRNMVAAIRHWAIATGVIDETKNGLQVAWLGDMLFGDNGADPYLEHDGSLWLLHWHLVGRSRLTSAYWLFNEFRGGSFVRQDLILALVKLAEERTWNRVAATTVDRDLQCLLRTYIGARGHTGAGDSVLAELGLIRPMDKHRSRLSRGRKPSLPDAVFVYCLNEFWDRVTPDHTTMSFENAAFSPSSPGRVFLLDENDIVDRLERLDQVSDGALLWSETAGLRQIIRVNERSIQRERGILQQAILDESQRVAA